MAVVIAGAASATVVAAAPDADSRVSWVLHGRVMQDGSPVGFANVVVLDTREGQATDECGYFAIRVHRVPPVTVKTQAIGFLSETRAVNDTSSVPIVFSLSLEPAYRLPKHPAKAAFWSVSHWQGDAPGGVPIDNFGEHVAPRATVTRPWGRLELESVQDGGALRIKWRIDSGAFPTVTVIGPGGVSEIERTRVKSKGELIWKGPIEDDRVDSGVYLARVTVGADTLRLRARFERIRPLHCPS